MLSALTALHLRGVVSAVAGLVSAETGLPDDADAVELALLAGLAAGPVPRRELQRSAPVRPELAEITIRLTGHGVLRRHRVPFRRRRTRLGDRALRVLRLHHHDQSPRNRPAWTLYGPAVAAMGVALHGADAIRASEPAVAQALAADDVVGWGQLRTSPVRVVPPAPVRPKGLGALWWPGTSTPASGQGTDVRYSASGDRDDAGDADGCGCGCGEA